MNLHIAKPMVHPSSTVMDPSIDESIPIEQIPPIHANLEVNQHIEAVCRYGAHYDAASKFGDHAWMIDLYQSRAVITGFAEEWIVEKFPAVDSLVRITGVVIRGGESPTFWIRSFEPLTMLTPDVCIFDTALPHWISDLSVIARACRLWSTLSDEDRQFLNAVFFDPRVLRGFLQAPGSCKNHHAHAGGCIEHSVESAELAETLALSSSHLDRDLLVTTALIHDCGKSIEYARNDDGTWRMSRLGRRVGHKVSSIQLATIAMTRCPSMNGKRKESYTHMLACSYAPSWAGFRKPDIPEASVMCSLDRSSAEAGLRQRMI